MMRQHVSLYITAVGRVKVSLCNVMGKLGSNVTQGSVASYYKSAIHAKFCPHGFADAKFSCSVPHQLGEMPRFVLVGLVVEIVAAYLVIPVVQFFSYQVTNRFYVTLRLFR